MSPSPPISRRMLDIAIERLQPRFGEAQRLRRAVANTIVAQLLPRGVIKGGSALKFRYGDIITRVTKDMDAAQDQNLDDFISRLDNALAIGWHGFTGHIVTRPPATPNDVPPAYVMHPFDVKLEYNHKPWMTVRLEMGANEVDDTSAADLALPSDIIDIFEALGLPRPKPVPLMQLHHQVAQKLHALTDPTQNRPHDLIDLQLIYSQTPPDANQVSATCKRLFAHRRRQPWPSKITVSPETWADGYTASRYDLTVLPTVTEAIDWVNTLIDTLASLSE